MKKRFLSLFALFFLGVATSLWAATPLKKVSVLIDNDFCGDPDGLFALAQQVLEPSTHIVGIVGGHLNSNAGTFPNVRKGKKIIQGKTFKETKASF